MVQPKQRTESGRNGNHQFEKRNSRDNRNETVLLIAPAEPNHEKLAAMVREWIAPRLAVEFLRDRRQPSGEGR